MIQGNRSIWAKHVAVRLSRWKIVVFISFLSSPGLARADDAAAQIIFATDWAVCSDYAHEIGIDHSSRPALEWSLFAKKSDDETGADHYWASVDIDNDGHKDVVVRNVGYIRNEQTEALEILRYTGLSRVEYDEFISAHPDSVRNYVLSSFPRQIEAALLNGQEIYAPSIRMLLVGNRPLALTANVAFDVTRFGDVNFLDIYDWSPRQRRNGLSLLVRVKQDILAIECIASQSGVD